jgi:hypothetical protein
VRAIVDEDGEMLPEQPAIELAKKIIKYSTKAYKPDLFPNPGESPLATYVSSLLAS